jgi:hypothetical protein
VNKKAMLGPSILILIAFIIFAIILGFLFLIPLIAVGVNLAILYFLFLRIYTEITKYSRAQHYALSFAASALLLVIFKNFLPLWWITTASLLAFFITHIYILWEKKS